MLHLKPVSIVDENLFSRPVIAAVAFIPVGWYSSGSILWKPGLEQHNTWKTWSNDGSSFGFLSDRIWTWNNMAQPSQPQAPFQSMFGPGYLSPSALNADTIDLFERLSGSRPAVQSLDLNNFNPSSLNMASIKEAFGRLREGLRGQSQPSQPRSTTASSSAVPSVPKDGEQFLRTFVRDHRMNAEVIGVYPVLEEYATAQEVPQELAMGALIKSWSESNQILINYSISGNHFEEVIQYTTSFNVSNLDIGFGVRSESLIGTAKLGRFFRAPQGKLKLNLWEKYLGLISYEPAWVSSLQEIFQANQQEYAKFNRQLSNDVLRGAHRVGQEIQDGILYRGQVMRDAQKFAADAHTQSWQNAQEVQERLHQREILNIRNVEPYFDSRTGQSFEIPCGYQHHWRLDDGTFVFTNDHNFNPNSDWGTNAYKLKQIKI